LLEPALTVWVVRKEALCVPWYHGSMAVAGRRHHRGRGHRGEQCIRAAGGGLSSGVADGACWHPVGSAKLVQWVCSAWVPTTAIERGLGRDGGTSRQARTYSCVWFVDHNRYLRIVTLPLLSLTVALTRNLQLRFEVTLPHPFQQHHYPLCKGSGNDPWMHARSVAPPPCSPTFPLFPLFSTILTPCATPFLEYATCFACVVAHKYAPVNCPTCWHSRCWDASAGSLCPGRGHFSTGIVKREHRVVLGGSPH
jgi:hypothetical protein